LLGGPGEQRKTRGIVDRKTRAAQTLINIWCCLRQAARTAARLTGPPRRPTSASPSTCTSAPPRVDRKCQFHQAATAVSSGLKRYKGHGRPHPAGCAGPAMGHQSVSAPLGALQSHARCGRGRTTSSSWYSEIGRACADMPNPDAADWRKAAGVRFSEEDERRSL
jgi:hypothetical protein